MKLYLVRHGEASSSEGNPQRPLTDKGRKDTEKVAELIGRLCPKVKAIEHSGKLRAEETANILSSAVDSEEDVARTDGLAPDDPVEPWVKNLLRYDGDIMLVGHLPFLSRLASSLLLGDETHSIVNFRPSSVLCLEKTGQDPWQICFFITPELL
jgi:phosphohistidine phosphatase